jgi:4-hydroxy-tetrahydrodipicolinate reductase
MIFQAAIGQTDPVPQDRVIIKGEPSIDVVFTGGVHGDIATSAMTLNAISSLMAAPPGLHTSATVPLLHIARGG